MALTRQRKLELAQEYKEFLDGAKNVIIVKQTGIPVNEMTGIRKGLAETNGAYKVIKKRVFLKALADSGYEDVNVDVLDQSVALLCAYDDEYAPLKVVANKNKEYQADKAIEYGFDYIGGWFDKQWFDGEYVSELANIPSKDELIGKFLYLLKYPMQGFAMAASEIAKKAESDDVKVGDLIAPKTEENTEEAAE